MATSLVDSDSTIVIPKRSSKEIEDGPSGSSFPEKCGGGFSREAVASWLRGNGSELFGAKLENCRKRGLVLSCLNGHRWAVRIRCDLRICPDCLKRLGRKVWDVRARDMNSLAEGRPGWSWKLLTLTLRREGDSWTKEGMAESIRKIWKCGRALLKANYLSLQGAGAVGVTEVGRGGNVHIHLMVWGPYVPQERLSEQWLKLTGDSKIVDVRKVWGSLRGALGYIGKYLSKVPGFGEAYQFGIYLQALVGQRRIHTFGCLLRSPDSELSPGCVCRDCGLGLSRDWTFYDRWRMPPWDWVLAGIDGVEPLSG